MSEEQDSTFEVNKVVDLAEVRKRQKSDLRKQLEAERRRREKIIDDLNKNWCVVNDHGTVWIFQEVQEEISKRPGFRNIYRQEKRHFQTLFMNRPYEMLVPSPTARDPNAVKTIVTNCADLWLKHPRRRTYLRAEFAPGQQLGRSVYNLWTGWGVEPIKPQRGVASCDKYLDHVFHVICSGNPVWYDYLLNWLAHMVQRPGEPGQVAVVLRGGEGIGKSLFGSYPLIIFGRHALHLTNSEHLQGRYNLHLQSCVFLFADEALWAGDKSFEGTLRGMITEERLPVEPKYQNLYETNNCLHPLISSNNDFAAPMATDARRFYVLDVPDTRKDDKVYFDALVNERDRQNGPAALLSGRRVVLKRVSLYEATLGQLRLAARANNRSIAKQLAVLFARDPVEEARELVRRPPEEDLAACARLLELAGDDRADRAEVQRAVALFITSPLGRAIQLAAVDIASRKVIDGLAEGIGCTRMEAANWWLELVKVVLPHIRQSYAAEPETG
jgi:hypothetical protein